jgi:hypothetical protein
VWLGVAVAVAADRDLPGYELVTAALAFSLAAGVINELGTERDE